MDMKKCPACAKEIPDNSNFCPECGIALTSEVRKVKRSPHNKVGFGCMISIVLVFVVGWASTWVPTEIKEYFRSPYPEIGESAAVAICGRAFEKSEKHFPFCRYQSAKAIVEKDQWIIQLPADIQNASGDWRRVVVHCRCQKDNPDPDNEISPEALLEMKVVPVPESK